MPADGAYGKDNECAPEEELAELSFRFFEFCEVRQYQWAQSPNKNCFDCLFSIDEARPKS